MRCTCGAQPVEDALFCHKCGRPLREDLIAREAQMEAEAAQVASQSVRPQPAESQEAPPNLPAIQAPVFHPEDIGFHNPVAVRIALLVALVGFLGMQMLGLVPGGLLLFFPMLLFVGVAGVYFYKQRTGVLLQPLSGARMGWLTGLFVFLIVLVIAAVTSAALMASKMSFTEAFRKTMESNPAATPEARAQFEKLGTDDMAALILLVIATFFILLTVLPTIGGLLGAKFMAPRGGSSST